MVDHNETSDVGEIYLAQSSNSKKNFLETECKFYLEIMLLFVYYPFFVSLNSE